MITTLSLRSMVYYPLFRNSDNSKTSNEVAEAIIDVVIAVLKLH
jgi:hypothetical protein